MNSIFNKDTIHFNIVLLLIISKGLLYFLKSLNTFNPHRLPAFYNFITIFFTMFYFLTCILIKFTECFTIVRIYFIKRIDGRVSMPIGAMKFEDCICFFAIPIGMI